MAPKKAATSDTEARLQAAQEQAATQIEELQTALQAAKAAADEGEIRLKAAVEQVATETRLREEQEAAAQAKTSDLESKLAAAKEEAVVVHLVRSINVPRMQAASYRTAQVSGNQVAEQLQSRLEASEKRCMDLEAQSAELEKKLRAATEEVATEARLREEQALAAQAKTSDLESQLAAVKEEDSGSHAKTALLTKPGEKVAEQLQSRLEASEKRCMDLEVQSAELEKKLRAATEEAAERLHAKLEESEKRYTDLEAAKQKLADDLRIRGEELEAAQRRCAELEAQRESERLKAENTALERDVVDLARHLRLAMFRFVPYAVNKGVGDLIKSGIMVQEESVPVVCGRRDWRLLATETRPARGPCDVLDFTDRFCVACCHCWHEDKSVEQLDISKAESYGFAAEDGEEDEGHAFSVGLGSKDAPSTFIIKLPRATGSDRLMLDKTDVHNEDLCRLNSRKPSRVHFFYEYFESSTTSITKAE
ncbi:hypothetical protein AK812_SmicGene29911 [Symbiodinium microadriaticum]|uniref:Uncharacterized protein n=1 Tax=Symbiodinium microadriaticum TaxID=2951 RepID=A0A1Q9D0M5_SYMMI|nr:hypothetical protein AK812_SmicGene29911 [Symbiodinium microadriaticum]